MHKHSVDIYGNWLKMAEYLPPTGGEWDNPFVLRVDQQARSRLMRGAASMLGGLGVTRRDSGRCAARRAARGLWGALAS